MTNKRAMTMIAIITFQKQKNMNDSMKPNTLTIA